MENDDDVAIVGIGCNFPGGEGIDNFWQVLVEGKNCTVEVSRERFNIEDWYDADESQLGKSRTRRAAFIEGLNEFDNKFFGISDSEAERLDPQQKLLLECTYRALENAGIPAEELSGSRTGVFIGIMNKDYEFMSLRSPRTVNHYTATGTAMSIAANRISYVFDLTGPSLAIDTACSSSLVALYYAFLAIKQGDCETAFCGGVSCMLDPAINVMLSKAKMLSPDGMSKPFSRRADGYGRGEGCGIVLLKPLRKVNLKSIWGGSWSSC
ncbi:putative inactive phenolphthiocerol synthesis polyketide synthase type I Pks15 [Sorex araneus]|uniref:putative inactive phenolphthiocerol synthesis polyketide synthase type I Pks15 n=1 Tax=Sorex araneus TaxID=42254 RepID=UPI002433F699|nr:putative inactive phenolphthiocerol synthesis polyketide synthase type I Pks15 [Sorex araneus]